MTRHLSLRPWLYIHLLCTSASMCPSLCASSSVGSLYPLNLHLYPALYRCAPRTSVYLSICLSYHLHASASLYISRLPNMCARAGVPCRNTDATSGVLRIGSRHAESLCQLPHTPAASDSTSSAHRAAAHHPACQCSCNADTHQWAFRTTSECNNLQPELLTADAYPVHQPYCTTVAAHTFHQRKCPPLTSPVHQRVSSSAPPTNR